MNWTSIASTAEAIATMIEGLAPLASAAGPEGAVIGALIAKGAEWVSSALTAAQTGVSVLGAISSDDLATIQAADAKIVSLNITLSQEVATS